MRHRATSPEGKVTAAFKGVIRSYKLDPSKRGRLSQDPQYVGTFRFFDSSQGEGFRLLYRKWEHQVLLDLVDRLLCPGQVDRGIVSTSLDEAVAEWICEGHSLADNIELEKASRRFIVRIRSQIKCFEVYVPVIGLEGDYPAGLQLGRCKVYPNYPGSELQHLVTAARRRRQLGNEYLSAVEQAPAFFKVKISAHRGRTDREARKEARLSLDLIRLFLGSHYHDIHFRGQVPRRMELVGAVLRGEHSPVLRVQANVPLDEQYPGESVKIKHYTPFNLSGASVRWMQQIGLARINQLVSADVPPARGSISARLTRSIHWFAGASTRESIADSFVAYAISVESLLSEGRTTKETYARRMAALVLREDKGGTYPLMRFPVSREFSKKLTSRRGTNRFDVVESRVIELFRIRNGVVHGRVLDHDVDPSDLVDFEALVAGSIISYVNGGWETLGQFKAWIKKA